MIKSIHECREKGIRFHYAVLGNVNGIDSLDMGNLVHNLLQNGIEACSRQGQEREMEIVVRRDRDMIEIEMDNTAQEYVLKKNPLLKTSKRKKKNMDLVWRVFGRLWSATMEITNYGRKKDIFFKGSH